MKFQGSVGPIRGGEPTDSPLFSPFCLWHLPLPAVIRVMEFL